MARSILQQLDEEWSWLAKSPTARRTLVRWGESDDALRGYNDLVEVLAARRNPALAEGILAALAARAPLDDLACRTLLQAVIPGLVKIASTARDDPAAIDEVVSLAWERIRTYPSTRKGSVAANVLLDVNKRYRKHRRLDTPSSSGIGTEVADSTESTEEQVLGRLLVAGLVEAQREGVMSAPVLSAILRTRLCGERLADVAADQAIPAQLLCHRRWRAEVRLRDLPLAG